MATNRPAGCEGCKKPTTIHLTQIINGVTNKIDLCSECPNAKNFDDPQGFSLADQLLGLGAAEAMKGGNDELVCPNCGFTQPDFKKSGRLGCPQCYETFAEGLTGLLKNMHRGTQHRGKVPERLKKAEQMRIEVQQLHGALRSAISSEDFEGAAALRDKIRDLESRIA